MTAPSIDPTTTDYAHEVSALLISCSPNDGNVLEVAAGGAVVYAVTAAGVATAASDETVTGALTVTGATALNGNVAIGDGVTDTVGFYGHAGAAQRAGSAQAAVATTAATNSSPYGYAQAQADAIVTLVNELRAALVAVGLIKGSA